MVFDIGPIDRRPQIGVGDPFSVDSGRIGAWSSAAEGTKNGQQHHHISGHGRHTKHRLKPLHMLT